MPSQRRRGRRTVRRVRSKKRGGQRGGFFPLLALIPAAIAAGKAATLGAVSGAAGYGIKKALAGKKKSTAVKATDLKYEVDKFVRRAKLEERRLNALRAKRRALTMRGSLLHP